MVKTSSLTEHHKVQNADLFKSIVRKIPDSERKGNIGWSVGPSSLKKPNRSHVVDFRDRIIKR